MDVIKNLRKNTYPDIDPLRPELSTRGRSALVTGAGTGVGAAIAKALAQSGVSELALLGRTESTLEQTKAEISALGLSGKVFIFVADITDPASLNTAVKTFADSTSSGKIDILIANAAHMSDLKSIVDLDASDFWDSFRTTVLGNFHLLQAFQPVAAPNASIIHITTAAIVMPYIPGYAAYRSSKIAAYKLFETFFYENPGFFGLHVHPGLIFGTASSGKFEESLKEAGYGHLQDDISISGDFVVWSLSEQARFLNGRFVSATWDVEELKSKKTDLENDATLFTVGLLG
jgi:NAD(P)-dependent dehydrogenase (short-subunit alcohol dehydrogenase family)